MSDHSHMTPDEFRRHGHDAVEWVAAYMEALRDLPIVSTVKPGEIRARLPAAAPEEPEPFDALLRDLDEIVLPGITHWQAPGWFAYFPANTSGPSILAELVAAGLGAQGMLWATSPALTEIEAHVLDWLVDLLGLAPHFKTAVGPGGGVIQMSASDSTHLVHVVARDRAVRDGAAIDRLVAYGSSQAHSSVERGARVAGFSHMRLLDVDEAFALRADALREAIAQDRAAGLVPTIVTSAVGTTATGAVDPVAAVAGIAREHGLWHHVDAAWAGSAMLCEEQRRHQAGAERADSYTFNPHKWLFTNFDCNVLWVADRAPLIASLSILPPYLRNAASESGDVIDYRDWHVPLGRRFRALKLWWVLRSYGAAGLRQHLRAHIALAAELGRRVDEHPRLERVAPVSFALVCLRHTDGTAATDALAAAINAHPDLYVTPSVIDDTRFVRVAVGQTHTTADDVERLWQAIADAA
ncbi:MAG: aromatic-L-amino-acid/L-tryptophan decarboxylase [Solirubrobacteraceae bacterium]|jgi:aromatic-L-amino-acid decarboxylase|nr:aromatic-L-amino-acid/L-tryptophan decarboxylase [Solirubrobacteraceae bacterium]